MKFEVYSYTRRVGTFGADPDEANQVLILDDEDELDRVENLIHGCLVEGEIHVYGDGDCDYKNYTLGL